MTTRAIGRRGHRPLLARLLETPDLPRVVRSLDPRALHQLVRTCGLEGCGPIVALASAEQLIQVFDDDLWTSDAAGQEERFDADRFGLWLEVLVEEDAALAARKLVEMDFQFVTAALTRHLLVVGPGALEEGPAVDVGGYRVVARRGESWDALVSLLVALESAHHAFFSRLMSRCHRISTEFIEDNGGLYEVLTAEEQVLSDAAGDRERRREEQGYVAPSQAAAFLEACRRTWAAGECPGWDPVTAAYFRERRTRAKDAEDAGRRPATAFAATPRGGIGLRRDRPLLLTEGGDGGPGLSRLRAHLIFVREHDGAVHEQRLEEIAYLANVLVAGCSFQSRRFRAVEATQAVLATCNLGLENWPPRGGSRSVPGFLLDHDLVTVFRRGWSLLHERVCLHVARRVAEAISGLTCDDREVRAQLAKLGRGLKAQVRSGAPWRERDNLDVIAILDPPTWATLLGLVDECPVLPRAADKPAAGSRPLRVASGFDFISENSQVARVHEFADSLRERLVWCPKRLDT